MFVVATDATFDFAAWLKFRADRMTYFMVPRFFELIDALPKSPTQRLQNLLRACGNGPATWDREVKGYRVTRNGLVTESPLAVEMLNQGVRYSRNSARNTRMASINANSTWCAVVRSDAVNSLSARSV